METLLIHGDNESQIQQVILDWRNNFTLKYPNSTFEKYSNLEFEQIKTLVQSQDMFSDKKLIIIEDSVNILNKANFTEIFETQSDNVLLLVEKQIIKKNLKIYKHFKKENKIYEYLIKNFDLKKYINNELSKSNKKISPINLNYLISKLQNQIQNTNQE